MADTPEQPGQRTSAPERGESEDAPTLVFSQVPRLELEELLTELVSRAQEVLRTQGRLRALLRATQTVATGLSLPVVLRHIVEAARELVGARYAALGLLGPDRRLAQFVHAGIDADMTDAIGQLAEGKGILGMLMGETRIVRLADLSVGTRSVGLPPAYSPMHSFVGVPVRSRGEMFGNLYLAEKETGAEFTAEDEELLGALAGAAAVAIDNARMYEETRLRERWQEMSVETTAALLADLDETAGLDVVVRQARRLANSDAGVIALLTADGSQTLRIAATSGANVSALLHREMDFAGSLTEHALRFSEPLRLTGDQLNKHRAAADCPPLASAVLTVPLFAMGHPLGALILSSASVDASHDDLTVKMVAGFAAQAAVAMQLAQARKYQAQIIALSGREDLIRDLNDRVVSRLFAAGLQMHGLAAAMSDNDQAQRVAAVVGELDLAIRDIRDAVLHLSF